MSNATSLSASIGVIYDSVFPPAHHEDHILRNKNDQIKHTSGKLPIKPTVYTVGIHPLNETRSRSDYTDSFKSSVCGEASESCMQETRLLVWSHVARLNRNKMCIHIYMIFKLASEVCYDLYQLYQDTVKITETFSIAPADNPSSAHWGCHQTPQENVLLLTAKVDNSESLMFVLEWMSLLNNSELTQVTQTAACRQPATRAFPSSSRALGLSLPT